MIFMCSDVQNSKTTLPIFKRPSVIGFFISKGKFYNLSKIVRLSCNGKININYDEFVELYLVTI